MTTWKRHEPRIVQLGGEDSRRVTESRAAVWSRPLDRRHDLIAGYWKPGTPIRINLAPEQDLLQFLQ